ncbi:hypothetical protein [Alkalihalobacterium bogoriense]|uniref:hypothetical protein n=1 Tax=Alkalihalobacterium bogoriense TaxID=246272 RepID=UPI00047B05A2|nr:hypothetical protein [Alkalihalobacterium bogoriense]
MTKEKRPLTISIAGVSGGGKTSVTQELNALLHKSKMLSFDDYDFEGPHDIIDWVDRGANYDEWNLDPLIQDIEALHSEPLNYILLDYPFAYKHTKIKDLIDVTVFIDTPLDIAMARRIMRDCKNSSTESIIADMENYVSRGRRGYVEMLHTIKPNSDIIVDGILSTAKLVREIKVRIEEN